MSRGGAGKRLEPKMTRGGFRFVMTMACIMVAFEVIVLVLRLFDPWDSVSYWYIAMILVTAGLIGRLLHVRRRDSAFWDKEEAEREDGINGDDSYKSASTTSITNQHSLTRTPNPESATESLR